MGDSKKATLSGQAEWEAQKKVRDALERRKKINETMLYHFDDDLEKRKTRQQRASGAMGSPHVESPKSPLASSSGGSPLRSPAGGQLAYDMKMKGLVFSGSWHVQVAEHPVNDLPGKIGIVASVHGRWDHRRKYCPVVASRLVLKSGKHTYKVQIIAFDRDKLLSTHGMIKVGFFESDMEAKESWDVDAKIGKAWYYKSMGNVYNGSIVAPNVSAPGFEPGDIISATINIVERTVSFTKTRILSLAEDRPPEVVSDEYTVHGVDADSFRFGVQFERECPGVVLRDYAEESADDAMYRGKGFKGYGMMHVQRREFEEAQECFKKSGSFFHVAGDRRLRKQAAEMLTEAKYMQGSGGIETPGSTVFDMITAEPIEPMKDGFVDPDAAPPPAASDEAPPVTSPPGKN